MAETLRLETNTYDLFREKDISDVSVDSYYLMKTPGPVLTIVAAYFAFIFWVGPVAMAKRKPYQLKPLLMVYNLIQVLWAAYILLMPLRLHGIFDAFMNCCRIPGAAMVFHPNLAYMSWHYFVCKIVDLLDTVFFVLRKKQRQISFLHVYHHSVMVLSAWAYLKFILDPSFAVLELLNTGVHFIMYSYYFISSLGPTYAKYIWWKKYMTWIQLCQFGIAIAYISSLWFSGCEISTAMGVYIVTSVAFLIILFSNFYLQTYTKSKKVT